MLSAGFLSYVVWAHYHLGVMLFGYAVPEPLVFFRVLVFAGSVSFPGVDVWRPFLISGCGGGLLLVLAEPFVEWSLLSV